VADDAAAPACGEALADVRRRSKPAAKHRNSALNPSVSHIRRRSPPVIGSLSELDLRSAMAENHSVVRLPFLILVFAAAAPVVATKGSGPTTNFRALLSGRNTASMCPRGCRIACVWHPYGCRLCKRPADRSRARSFHERRILRNHRSAELRCQVSMPASC